MAHQPVDIKQRALALDPLCSFICEAPAGSGKTELLTQRVLTLLARVEKPECILAITFTRKAAAEMRDRILGALISGAGPEPVDHHAKTTWHLARNVLQVDQLNHWNLLLNPNRLQIRTFDSLCAMLTQTLPLQASLGANVGISSDTDALYREAIAELMATLECDVAWADNLSDLLLHLDNRYDRIEDLLLKMLRSRDAWMPLLSITQNDAAIRGTLEEHLRSAIADKETHISLLFTAEMKTHIAELGAFAASNLLASGVESPINSLKNIELILLDNAQMTHEHWSGIAELLLTKTGDWRKRLDKNGGFPPGVEKGEKVAFKQQKEKMLELIQLLAERPAVLEALRGIPFWPTASYADVQWTLLKSLMRVLPVLVAQLQLVFRSRGEVDFLEMSARAQQALGDSDNPTDLLLRLDHKIQHILADEFQDTSFPQIALLQKLTSGWQAGDGRTLFCVGDAMQSIYGFRGANVGLFLHCKTYGLGDVELTPLQLTTNFRSQAGVVKWINATFKQAFPSVNDISTGAVVYASADPFRAELPEASIRTHLYSHEAEASYEGNCIADLIMGIQTASPESSVAILVRTKSHAKSAVRALKVRNIKFRAVDLESLSEQAVIQDLMSLTRSLLFPDDRIAWLSMLRSPWCGLMLADLLIISEQIHASENELLIDQIEQYFLRKNHNSLLSVDGQKRLSRVTPVLLKALEERSRKPLRQWIEGVWVRVGGPACLHNKSDSENAQRYFQCLEELSAQGDAPTADMLTTRVAALFAAADPEADDRLQIMTIHKSKGLEFDEVILPSLDRRPRGQDTELLLWQERLSLHGQEEWLLAPISATGEEKDPIYRYLEREKSIREKYESCRLLYVACTRAKKKLHLFARVQPVEGEVGQFKPPASSSLLAPIWPMIEGSTDTVYSGASQLALENTSIAKQSHGFFRLPQDWQPPPLPEVSLLQSFIVHSAFDNRESAQRIMQPVSKLPRCVGTLIHHILQMIGEQGIAFWLTQSLTDKTPFWKSRLLGLGATEEEAESALPSIVACIDNMLSSERFHWLMSGDCQFEYQVTGCENGVMSNHIIDLLMCDETGGTWVVDYKTSTPSLGESVDAFVVREKLNYRNQLKVYRELIKQLGYNDTKSALFFVILDLWVECE